MAPSNRKTTGVPGRVRIPFTISRWKQRYERDGVLGLATIHPGQPQKLTPQLHQGSGADAASSTGWLHALVVA
jgi:transposase